MVVAMGLGVLPWPIVSAWTGVTVLTLSFEHCLLRRMAGAEPAWPMADLLAPTTRILTTTLYALAAFALLTKGGPGEHLFAFALISASVVHVLMRHYRSPVIMAASLSPYVIVLGAVGVQTAHVALAQGKWLSALAPGLAVVMFAIQLWSARAQLAGAWGELVAARHSAEARERAADAANCAKSQFLATMSHELRTPLNAVLGMAQAMAGRTLAAAQRERLEVIRCSGESLLAVLNDLLDLSKIEADALEPELVEFDLEDLVSGIVATYRPLAERKGLAFGVSIAEDACGRYLGDSPRIRRVLYGLCDNAVKFTPAGSVAFNVARTADGVAFHVADTGIGASEDDLVRIFEGFFQADSTSTRRHGGAGVGLTISAKLASLMKGAIEAQSTPGKGSVFTLVLPLGRVETPVAAAEATGAREDKGERIEGEPSAQPRILVAEDNVTNQLVLKTLLEPAGIEPTLVANGREAVATWEDQAWDLILMDIQMPEMDGVEATRMIRRRETESGRIRTPIIAVTANAMTHQTAEYAAAGMDDVLAKPVNVAKLYQAIERACVPPDRIGMRAAS